MKKGFQNRPAARLPVLLGGAVWILLALAGFLPRIHLGIIEVLFLLGPWIVAPLGADLLTGGEASPRSDLRGPRDGVLLAAATLTTISFFLNNRIVAAGFAGAWLLVCAGFALDGLRRLVRSREKSFSQFCFAAGEGYLLVAGIWLVASRAGIPFMGFQEPIVLLTGVHFHFAGFASAVLAGLTYERLRESPGAVFLRVAIVAVICGPGILGLAFLLGPKVKLVAAIMLAVGQIGLAAGMFRVGLSAKGRRGRWFLFVAGGSVAAGMALAAIWAIGEYPLQAFVNIRQMAQFHGVLNAIGFAVCGLLGWAQLKKVSSDPCSVTGDSCPFAGVARLGTAPFLRVCQTLALQDCLSQSRVTDHATRTADTPETNRACQLTTGSRRLAAASSLSLAGREAGFRPRVYCLGEHPRTRLKAVLKALSDS
jgi:YndJ-like protein